MLRSKPPIINIKEKKSSVFSAKTAVSLSLNLLSLLEPSPNPRIQQNQSWDHQISQEWLKKTARTAYLSKDPPALVRWLPSQPLSTWTKVSFLFIRSTTLSTLSPASSFLADLLLSLPTSRWKVRQVCLFEIVPVRSHMLIALIERIAKAVHS